jgi:cytoskeletal protein CcmA (bactofilin family)
MAEPTTIIGELTSVQGNIQGDEDLVVLGRVEGIVQIDRTLVIEPSGVVKADVSVRNVMINGVVVGNVTATESVHIAVDGKMVGDISAPRVVIADGAMFRGKVDMGDVEPVRAEPTQKPEQQPRRSPFARSIPQPARLAAAPPRRPPVEPASEPARRPLQNPPEDVKPAPTPSRKPANSPARPDEEAVKFPEPVTPEETRPLEPSAVPPPAKRRRTGRPPGSEPVPVEPPPPKPRIAVGKRRVSVRKKG